MAVLTLPTGTPALPERLIEDETEIRATLAPLGIEYERWDLSILPDGAAESAPAETVLAAFAERISEMQRRGGYTTVDVVDVNPKTPGLDAMLARFEKEHTHSEDEVRFVLAGRGIFFFHIGATVAQLEVAPGDLIRVPTGTTHWFTLCTEKRIRAVRWFQDTAGWTPHYTDSGIDQQYQPLCFGPAYIGSRVETPFA
jgi:1,2-dihydroxy-3-keto-5-methylthiopentene dioxygenase